MTVRTRSLVAAAVLVLLGVWLLLIGRRSGHLVVETVRQIGTRLLSDADRQALRDLVTRAFGGSDVLPSVMFVAAVFLVVLGLPLVVRAWRPSRTVAVLGAVCVALAVALAVGASALWDVCWLLALGAAAFELGHRVLVRLTAVPDDRLEAFVVCTAVGSGCLGLLGLALGSAGLLNRRWVGSAVLILVGSLGARVAMQRLERCRDPTSGAERTGRRPPTAFDTALLGLIAGSMLLGYVMALAPEVQSDAIRMHLAMARVFVRDAAVPAMSSIYPSLWPVNAQVLFAMGLALHGAIVAKLLHAAAGVLTVLAAGLLARRLAGRQAGLIAAALTATLPLGIWEMGTAYVDFFATGYVAVAALCFFSWQESGERKWLWVAGGLLGFAVASKLTAGFAVAGFVVALVVAGRTAGWSRERTRAVAWITLGIMATLGPWLLRSIVLTGQIPGLELLRDSLLPATAARPRSLANLPSFGVGRHLAMLPTLPWELTFNTQRFGENPPGFIGLGPLLALPAVLFLRPRRRWATLAILVVVPTVFWFLSAQYLRYLMPTLVLLFVLVACGVEEVLERALPLDRPFSPRGRALLAGVLLLALASSPMIYLLTVLSYPGGLPVRHVLGTEPAEDYLVRTVRQVPVLRRLDGLVAPGTPVAVYPEGSQLYSDALLLGVFNGAPWLISSRSASEMLDVFERNGISYLIVDRNIRSSQRSGVTVLDPRFLQAHAQTVYAEASVYLYRMHAAKTPATPETPELLVNPSFEIAKAGGPEGWHPVGAPAYDTSGTRAHEGRLAVQVKTSSAFFQRVPVQAGVAYVLSHFSRCDGPSASVRLQVNWMDASDTPLSVAIELRRATATSYAKQTMWVQAPARAAFGVVYAASHDEAVCWYDDFSFKEAR